MANKKTKKTPKAKIENRRVGESLTDYYIRQQKHREAELREIEANKDPDEKEELAAAEIEVDRPRANAILFAQIGVSRELARSLRKHGGKPKNVPLNIKIQADEYGKYIEENLSRNEKDYIEVLRKGSKDINLALDACDTVIGYYKLERVRDTIKQDTDMDILAKADELYETLAEIAAIESIELLISAGEISMDFRMGLKNGNQKNDILSMLIYTFKVGGDAVVARFTPAYKDKKESRYFAAMSFKDGECHECTEEENKAYFVDFMGGKIPENIECSFTTISQMMLDYGLTVSEDIF